MIDEPEVVEQACVLCGHSCVAGLVYDYTVAGDVPRITNFEASDGVTRCTVGENDLAGDATEGT